MDWYQCPFADPGLETSLLKCHMIKLQTLFELMALLWYYGLNSDSGYQTTSETQQKLRVHEKHFSLTVKINGWKID